MSGQLHALDSRLTAGEQRRRAAKIARRRARGIGHTVVAFKRTRWTWPGFAALRKMRKAAQDAAGEWLSNIIARRDALAAKSTPTCPYHHVIKATEKTPRRVVTCGARMRPLPMRKGVVVPDWRCSKCGRAWSRAKSGGWERVS